MALAATACTSGKGPSGSSASPSASAASSPAPTGPATVGVATTSLGPILVDGSGRTLYLFLADTGTSSTCYTACAVAWPPPLTKGAPKAAAGANASDLSATTRTDGTTQITYAGHPLYYYVGDTKPGQTTGQALNQFGALWYVVSPSGNKVG